MKRLNTYINEWKLNDQYAKTDSKFFVYNNPISSDDNIRIFGNWWIKNNYSYENKVYDEYGNKINITNGLTKHKFPSGKYKFYIEDIDNITDCEFMFEDCRDLISVPLFDTSNITNMKYMFMYCSNLEYVPKFNTSNVKVMTGMFQECFNIKVIPLFDTSKVETMENAFSNCTNLIKIPKFNTHNVWNMNGMFAYCTKISECPAFDISNLKTMEGMFLKCVNIENVPIFSPSDILSEVKYMNNAFSSCEKLNDETIKNWEKIYCFELNCKR